MTASAFESIDSSEQIDVNGSKQWLFYRGEDVQKPVVLFVHGGPGSPLTMFSRGFDNIYIKDFVVVHWDQRNSGKSFDPQLLIETFSLEQVAKDGLVIVEHIKEKLGRSQILIVGHSWGSAVAARMTQRQPSDFSAFISVGTLADMEAGDRLKFETLKKQVEAEGTDEDKKDFIKLGPPRWKHFDQILIQSRLMIKFKGTFRAITLDQLNEAAQKCTDYDQATWESLDKSMLTIWHHIEPFLATYKAIKSVPALPVRTFFAQGAFDLATPTSLAQTYFDQVNAPSGKRWVLFEHSAHFPMYEEPAKFLELLKQASDS